MSLELKEIQDIISNYHCHVFEHPFTFHFGCILCAREGFDSVEESAQHMDFAIDHVFYVQGRLWRRDMETGQYGWGSGSKEFLSPHMTEDEIVKRCLVIARDYSEHEVREESYYEGKRLFGPHISIRALMSVAGETRTREAHKPEWAQRSYQ